MNFTDRWVLIIESRVSELEKELEKTTSDNSLRSIYVFLNLNRYLLKLFNGGKDGKVKR